MFKQAFRSYLASLHPRNYKKIKNSGFGGFWFYLFIVSPILNRYEGEGDISDGLYQAISTITILAPFLIMWWSNLGHKLSMPKLMYMLPMKAEGRKEYLNTLLAIKIGFPVMVGFIIQVVLGVINGIDWLRVVLSTCGIFSFGIGMYVCSELRSKFDRYIRYGVRGKDGHGKDAVLNWMCMIYSTIYFLVVLAVEVEVEGGTLSLLGWAWTLGFLSIMIIMDIAIIKTRYEATIEDVCNYEEAFNVLGKVEK